MSSKRIAARKGIFRVFFLWVARVGTKAHDGYKGTIYFLFMASDAALARLGVAAQHGCKPGTLNFVSCERVRQEWRLPKAWCNSVLLHLRFVVHTT